MDKQEKIKIAVTSGIAAVILLILILLIAFSGKKDGDGQKLEDNIAAYSNSGEAASDNTEAAITASTEEISREASAGGSSGDEASTDLSVVTFSSDKDQVKASVSGNSFYAANPAVLNNIYRRVKYNVDTQLYEMYEYWFAGNLEAVRDLAHLERFEAMSYALSGSNDFFYYGEKDSEGRPQGMGLAVYANSQYYYGSWSQGKRQGSGTWINFYPNYNVNVVKEHLYYGNWNEDLPDGEGQEHFDYVTEYMNSEDIYLQNAIGGFSQGKYNGDMYVITVRQDGDTTEWDGTCEGGDWEEVPYAAIDKKGRIPVLTDREDSENHIYMTRNGAKANGVSCIISGGNVR